ncbi:MAG TPA: hypothetical protein VG708_15400 [Mycobacteriales bacterium]|nr:hypothetical protein [Mycobacteriales bacterium]
MTGASKPAAASQTFHHVTKADYHQLRLVLPTMRGVEGITYQAGNLSVQFRDTAVKLDQTNVANIVQTVQGGGRPAGPTPSKSAKHHGKHHG